MTSDTDKQPAPPVTTALGDALKECAAGATQGLESLACLVVPHLSAVSQQFLETAQDVEDVIHDTLVIAWHNVWRFEPSLESPHQWLIKIFASRLASQCQAIAAPPTLTQWQLDVDQVSLPVALSRPPSPSPESLLALYQQLPPAAVDSALKARLCTAISLLNAGRDMPLTPSGEPADPSLFDPSLGPRMSLSRLAQRAKVVVNRSLTLPMEQLALSAWLNQAPGSQRIEQRGLPRRGIEARYADALDVNVDPRRLLQHVHYPRSFPDRRQRHRISDQLLWDGDWDIPTTHALSSRRMHFIADIWEHRRAPSGSRSYHQLAERLARGKPVASHSDGMVLDRPERILAYLRRYLLYMEAMACFGFDAGLGKDRLGAAINRHGQLVKINKGLHRMAMAQVIGIPEVQVRIRGVHRHWWQQVTGDARGSSAIERFLAALPECQPAPSP
ncbi:MULTISPECIES: sigma factor [unclassified Halomonas]|uniref:sigma factor n=1 Tax=unclassified Halomonas TaxID=2609666 RepID=UPI001C96606A|nr:MULTISPECIES: sigma factor [unclassified Halomonas]MBY5926709.1 hypothetical protein [Halomonas sp. DP4Y7-2]MBY6233578.1 hypothetical protein [Halomonas sp. DP4Y7-1]